jgi:hypothetical protein
LLGLLFEVSALDVLISAHVGIEDHPLGSLLREG